MTTQLVAPRETDYPGHIFRPEDARHGIGGCSSAYFKTNPIVRKIFIKRLQHVLQLLPPTHVPRTLDMGTGIGFLLPTLATKSSLVIAADYSNDLKTAARFMLDKRKITNVQLCRSDARKLPFPSETFDLIICVSMMEHIPEPAQVFQEFNRVLKKSGVAIVGWPIEHGLFKLIRKLELNLFRPKAWKAIQIMAEHGLDPWHITTWKKIENSISPYFLIDRKITMRLLFPVYRVLSLRKQ